MENQPFPSEVSGWTWDTVQTLSDSGQSENLHLEYKEHIRYKDTNQEKSKREWKRNIEREFTAFANASGGIIVFGMNDDGQPAPFEPPEHEVSRTVSRFIDKTTPPVETDVSSPLRVPSQNVDRIALAVRVYEATRKPVATSDSAYYARINDQKQPMSREQIESLFVDADRRQQAVRQLEMEINRFYEIINNEDSRFSIHGEASPDYHLLNVESLKEVLRENTHLFSDEDVSEAISRVFAELRGIEDREVYFERAMGGYTPKYANDNEGFYKKERKELKKRLSRLEMELKRLAKRADLQVKLLDE